MVRGLGGDFRNRLQGPAPRAPESSRRAYAGLKLGATTTWRFSNGSSHFPHATLGPGWRRTPESFDHRVECRLGSSPPISQQGMIRTSSDWPVVEPGAGVSDAPEGDAAHGAVLHEYSEDVFGAPR